MLTDLVFAYIELMNIEPVILESEFVRMEPLRADHIDGLAAFAFDESLWLWTVNQIANMSDLRMYVESALSDAKRGVSLPFVTIEKESDKIVGSSRFGNIDVTNRKTEIGWTWVARDWQRTRVNSEAKLLMLTHAFETWKCIRVELKTDALNELSRAAILRIGAKEEGILRNHMITDSGRFRNSVYFSIIESEWNDVKRHLSERLLGAGRKNS